MANMENHQMCPTCSMPREQWKGNGGHGYNREGRNYCCQGCADGSGCTCS